jgi:thiol-disulfide isomerase/thioredoxin
MGFLATQGCETKSPPPPAVPAVSLDIKSWDETLELVANHKGKIVVLDLWSTACDPCMVEFPHLVEMHKQHGSKVVCMSASCDYAGIKSKPPETYRGQVLEFLTKKGATFQNVLLNVESDTLFETIELASIPAVYVFGTDGKLAKRFDNDNAKPGEDFTYAKDIVPFVEKLLAE